MCSQDTESISLEEKREILSVMCHRLSKFGQESQHNYSNNIFFTLPFKWYEHISI